MLQDLKSRDNVDLSSTTVWCRTPLATQQLYRSLQRVAQTNEIGGLVAPAIIPLREWINKQLPLQQKVLTESMKQLVIAESVREHQSFFGHFSPWEIASELRDLFDGLMLAGHSDFIEPEFSETIKRAYGNPSLQHSGYSRESQVVLHLWEQWQKYIHESEYYDPIENYISALTTIDLEQFPTFYLFDYPRFSHFEKYFLHHLLANNKIRIYAHEHPSLQDLHLNDHPLCDFFAKANPEFKQGMHYSQENRNPIDLIFDGSISLSKRRKLLKQQFPSNPFADHMNLLIADQQETHAQSIVLQTRLWLLESTNAQVGIVCNDRQLARRLRALFERAAITVTDYGGWALSTTSAAAFIELWLDYIESEQKFSDLSLLFTSPFIRAPLTLLDEQIDYYQWVKEFCAPGSTKVTTESINQQISRFNTEIAMETLQFLNGVLHEAERGNSLVAQQLELHAATRFLIESLEKLQIYKILAADAAGSVLISLLRNSLESCSLYPLKVSWSEWRDWLRQLMENEYFVPYSGDLRVVLCNLEQATHLNFKQVIVAGCEDQRLIGRSPDYTFFNDRVRKELGLNHWQENKSIRFSYFRQLITQSSRILFTAEEAIGGQPATLASWLQQLRTLSLVCYNDELLDSQLLRMANNPDAQAQAPAPYTGLPDSYTEPARLQSGDVPHTYSASMYQTLLDCPYRYFSKYILELSKPENEDEWDASRFGQVIHSILHQFHFDHEGRPKSNYGQGRYTASNRTQLTKELTQLSSHHFEQSSSSKLLSRAWLSRWEKQIPSYIDWCIQNLHAVTPVSGEKSSKIKINDSVSLQGQIDRIDSNANQFHVVDYKTGSRIPSKKQVKSGEQVQLLCYARLHENTEAAYYLDLNRREDVKQQAYLDGEELKTLCDENIDRLTSIYKMLVSGCDLPAWGEQQLCDICEYDGICRKPIY